jgi:hypothetical protein
MKELLKNSSKLKNSFIFLLICFFILFYSCSPKKDDPEGMSYSLFSLMNLKESGDQNSIDSDRILTGVFYDMDGNPVPKARLEYKERKLNFMRQSASKRIVFSDANGYYEIPMDSDDLSVSVYKANGTSLGEIRFQVGKSSQITVSSPRGDFNTTEPRLLLKSTTNIAMTSISFNSVYLLTKDQFINPITPTFGGGIPSSCTILPALPKGLSFVGRTCAITGTPSVLIGETVYTVTATNSKGKLTGVFKLLIEQPDAPQSLTYSSSVYELTSGDPVTIFPQYSGGVIKSCSSNPSLSAVGLFLDPLTCNIKGKAPTIQGLTEYTVTVSTGASSLSSTFEMRVSPNSSVSPPEIEFEEPNYILTKNFTVTPGVSITNTGGGINTCTITPSLPNGLVFNTSTCSISGRPLANLSETQFTIRAENFGGISTAEVLLSVEDLKKPDIAYPGSYSLTRNFVSSSGVTPNNIGGYIKTCRVTPALPTGLTLSSACVITGSTSAPISPSRNYTITATNEAGTSIAVFALSIIANLFPPNITYADAPLALFQRLRLSSSLLTTNTGGAIDTCAVTPALPSGLTLNTKDCSISGTPTVIQSSKNYSITARNEVGTSTPFTLSIVIHGVPVIKYVESPLVVNLGESINRSISNTGGIISSCSISPPLADGMSFNTETCQVSGTTKLISPAKVHTITATNPVGRATTTFSIKVSSCNTFIKSGTMTTKNTAPDNSKIESTLNLTCGDLNLSKTMVECSVTGNGTNMKQTVKFNSREDFYLSIPGRMLEVSRTFLNLNNNTEFTFLSQEIGVNKEVLKKTELLLLGGGSCNITYTEWDSKYRHTKSTSTGTDPGNWVCKYTSTFTYDDTTKTVTEARLLSEFPFPGPLPVPLTIVQKYDSLGFISKQVTTLNNFNLITEEITHSNSVYKTYCD